MKKDNFTYYNCLIACLLLVATGVVELRNYYQGEQLKAHAELLVQSLHNGAVDFTEIQ